MICPVQVLAAKIIALIALGVALLFVMSARRPKRESPLNLKASPPPSPNPKLHDLEDMERNAAKAQAAKLEGRRKWLWPIGFFGRLTIYIALFFALYIFAPKDISDTPLAKLTLSDIGGTAAAILVGLVLVRALFEPSDDEAIKDVWGWLGVLMLAALFGAIPYSYGRAGAG